MTKLLMVSFDLLICNQTTLFFALNFKRVYNRENKTITECPSESWTPECSASTWEPEKKQRYLGDNKPMKEDSHCLSVETRTTRVNTASRAARALPSPAPPVLGLGR